jgi:hypothetical protein
VCVARVPGWRGAHRQVTPRAAHQQAPRPGGMLRPGTRRRHRRCAWNARPAPRGGSAPCAAGCPGCRPLVSVVRWHRNRRVRRRGQRVAVNVAVVELPRLPRGSRPPRHRQHTPPAAHCGRRRRQRRKGGPSPMCRPARPATPAWTGPHTPDVPGVLPSPGRAGPPAAPTSPRLTGGSHPPRAPGTAHSRQSGPASPSPLPADPSDPGPGHQPRCQPVAQRSTPGVVAPGAGRYQIGQVVPSAQDLWHNVIDRARWPPAPPARPAFGRENGPPQSPPARRGGPAATHALIVRPDRALEGQAAPASARRISRWRSQACVTVPMGRRGQRLRRIWPSLRSWQVRSEHARCVVRAPPMGADRADRGRMGRDRGCDRGPMGPADGEAPVRFILTTDLDRVGAGQNRPKTPACPCVSEEKL